MSQTNVSNPLDKSTLDMLQSHMLQITLPVLYAIVFSISIPLNSVSLWFLCRYSRPWTPIIVFSINLTISDLLYSMLLPFQIIYHLQRNNWIFGDFLCHAITVLFYGNMHCSLLTMTSISIERYLGIVHPLRYKVMRPIRTSFLTCIVIWILVLLPLLPLMQNRLTRRVEELNITTCFDVLPRNMFSETSHFIAYFGSLVFFFFLIPLFIMGFCYISIIRKLLHSSPTHLTESKKQTVYLLMVLLLLLFLFYIPHIVTAVVHYILVFDEKSAYVEYKLVVAIQSFNCCFDPFVYYFGSKEFRRKVQRKLCRCVAVGLSDHTPIFSEHNVQIMPKQKEPKK